MTTDATTSAGARSGRKLIPILLAIAVAATAAGAWLGVQLLAPGRSAPPALTAGTLLPVPRPLGDFALTDQDGAPLTPASLRGHWTFVAFGFTACPDVCPTTLANFAAIADRLRGQGAPPAEFLFVSVDPERDTPETIGRYVRHFDPAFRGATGSHEALGRLTAQLGVLYARAPQQETAMGYLVDHSAAILLLDPQVRLAAVFGAPHRPDAMAADFTAVASDTTAR